MPRSRTVPWVETGRLQSPSRVLVVIQLTGGNDALNTVIPVRSDAYYRSRAGLGIAPKASLRINDDFSLHPALTGLKSLYDQGFAAVVQGVGHPNPNRSHFKSMDIWHTASPEGRLASGWLGRYLDGHEIRAGFSVLPPVSRPCLANTAGVVLTPEIPLAMCGLTIPMPMDDLPNTLTGRLRAVSAMIASGSPARVYYVSQAGYDTHVDQADRHRRLLAELDKAIGDFVAELRSARALDRVLVMTFSEFGRSIAENASGGTEHGEAGVMFLIGPKVRPGLHGQAPSPDATDDPQAGLPWTTDFRRVYAAVLEDWLAVDPTPLLAARFRPLPVIA